MSTPAVTLRPYQAEAVQATLEHLSQGKHPVVSLPTGAGKGILVAALCQTFPDKRILVATHRKELLDQNERQLLRLGAQAGEIGVYSAGLERREMHSRVVFGGIQSIYKRIDALQQVGKFDVIICDEAHLCSPPSAHKDGNGHIPMYEQVFRACPTAQRVGLSATCYRLNDGLIYSQDPSSTWFTSLAYEIGMQRLIEAGYLSPLRGILTAANMPTDGVRIKAGEFVSKDLSERACDADVVTAAADELCHLGQNRQSWIVFCIDVAHTEVMTKALTERGIVCGVVTERTSSAERARVVAGARDGSIRALLNCCVFLVGFDVPRIDMVALLRPSQSKSLVVQAIGRGSRLSPETGKQDCLVCDLSGNLLRHKPLDALPEDKHERTAARQARDAKAREAQEEKARQEREWQHGTKASTEEPFSPRADGAVWLSVLSVAYDVIPSRAKPVDHILVVYRCQTSAGLTRLVKVVLCVEYPSTGGRGARWHAEQWWKRRSKEPCPTEAWVAVHHLKHLPRPTLITVAVEHGFDRVVTEYFGEGGISPQDAQEGIFPSGVHAATEKGGKSSDGNGDVWHGDIHQLIAYLASHGVTLGTGQGDTMYWRGPRKLATPEVLAVLKARKGEIRAVVG